MGYYQQFIKDFTTQAVPLTKLNRGSASNMVKWTDEAEAAINYLKMALYSEPVLAIYFMNRPQK